MPHVSRRTFLRSTAVVAAGLSVRTPTATAAEGFRVHTWERHAKNPVLPPGKTFDVGCCMNPFVMVRGDEYWMWYAGAEKSGRRRICLATCPIGDVTAWTRHGPLFETGGKGAFDESWCVLPCVHKVGDKWHLYYTGRSADKVGGLQVFRGMGLAVSDDLKTWKKYSDEPIMKGDGFPDWPDNKGIAGGGGRIHEVTGPDGKPRLRMYYTLATGRSSKLLTEDQAKQSVVADSTDGLTWTDRRVMLRPRPDVPYENAGVIALNVWKTKTRYRAVYAAIGSKFGAYSICEAVSPDGLTWDRGAPGENLSLTPTGGTGWESKMVEYPNIIEENGKLRMFYCGNGYGATGIGTATADPID